MIETKEQFDAHTFSRMAELILDLMTARHRLGEQLWTLSNRFRTPAKELEELGLLRMHSGNVPRTFRCSLSERALEWSMSPVYRPPILAHADSALAQLASERIDRAKTCYQRTVEALGYDPLAFRSERADMGTDISRRTP